MKLTKDEMRAWMLDKAKNASSTYDAECWLVTARTMGVDYDVEGCEYRLHCRHKNVTSAAESLQRMYMEFSSDSRFWDEIMQLIDAVKDDSTSDEVALFRRVFQNLLPDLQQTILLELAEKQTEKVEQCRFLLLLLRLFPDSASTFGIQLIDVLTDLEKNAQAEEPHENVYSQLLVCDVLPILLRSSALKLPESVCLELMKRAVRFYLSILSSSNRRKQTVPSAAGGTASSASVGLSPRAPRFKSSSRGMETPMTEYHHPMENVGGNRASESGWDSLLQCFTLIAERCRWDVGKKLKNFRLDHLQNVLTMLDTTSPYKTEVLFTSLLIFSNLVFKYSMVVGARESPSFVIALVPAYLREAQFRTSLQPKSETEGPTPAKVAKSSSHLREGVASAKLLPSSDNEKVLIDTYAVGKSCMKLLGDGNRDELIRTLLPQEKHGSVKQFIRDVQMLNGDFRRVANDLENILERGENEADLGILKLQLASCYLAMAKTTNCIKTLLSASIFDTNIDSPSLHHASVLQPFESDTWHYCFISDQRIVDYAMRCVVHGLGGKIMEKATQGSLSDLLLGHAIFISQYDWPRLSWLFDYVMKYILSGPQKRTKFSYPKFLTYVYCVDILEEFAHLNAEKRAGLTLDITETETTRKVGASTRHSVRDQKDDVRSMLETRASVACGSNGPSWSEMFLLFLSEQKNSLVELLQ